jgi:hypothetical protein
LLLVVPPRVSVAIIGLRMFGVMPFGVLPVVEGEAFE